MKEEKLFHAITDADDALIEEARSAALKKPRFTWRRIASAAACAVLVLGTVFVLTRNAGPVRGALVEVKFPASLAFDAYDAKFQRMENNPVDDAFLSHINDFAYQTASALLTADTGNMNYAPLSLYYALSLAATGARQETAEEMLSVLGAPDAETLSAQCGNLYRQLYTDNEIGKLKLANSLWLDSSVRWKKGFAENAAAQFYAPSFSADFSDEKTGQDMAAWISENTNGLLTPAIKPDARQILSILNTVYFCDEWTNSFDTQRTAADAFFLSDGTKASCDFMNSSSFSPFAKGDGFTRASLGLKNGGQMVFILPDEGISPRALLETPEKAAAAFEGGDERFGEVIWQVPKFSFGSAFELVDTLKALGIHAAFEPEADFSGITDEMAFISSIRQETHIGIDEKGVEAAAYTEIAFAGAGMPEDTAEMVLNRPFLYGITAADGTLLFIGVCENPAKG